jgi:hypothetical protein
MASLMTLPIFPGDVHGETVLSVQAQAWLALLPAPVRVHGIAVHAPELANRLAASWDDVPSTESLLESLLCESVRTLPVAIAAELLRLYEYHVRCRVNEAPATTWELPVYDAPRAARRAVQ